MLSSGLVALLQMLWPLLKESVFGNASFKEWMKRNISTCIWLVLMLAMLWAVLRLADLAKQQNAELVVLREKEKAMVRQNAELNGHLTVSRNQSTSLFAELAYERRWFASKLNPPPPADTPMADTPNKQRRRTKTNHNQTLIEALREWDSKHQTSPSVITPVPGKPSVKLTDPPPLPAKS